MPKVNFPNKNSDHKLPKRVLNTKPFCDCITCTCDDCPDVLKLLAITVTDTTCHFGSKVVKESVNDPGESTKGPNLLEVINPNRSCNCDVVARGIRDNVHMNIGMSERRDEIKRLVEECDVQCMHKCQAAESSDTSAENVINPKDGKPVPKERCKICGSSYKNI